MTRAEQIRKLKKWCFFEAGIPIVFLLGVYPVCRYLKVLDHSYERVFASGDLLTLVGFLLLSLAVDLEESENVSPLRLGFADTARYAALALSVLFLGAYGFFKAESLGATFSASIPMPEKFTGMAHISIAALIFCIFYCLWVRLRTLIPPTS